MTWSSGGTLEHPARAALNCVDEAVTALGEANLWSLSDSELLDLRVAQERSVARLQARVLATTREIDSRGAAGKVGAPSTAAWLKGRVGVAPGAAKREVALARELDVDLPVLRDALATGELSLGHARVVADAIGALPGGVDAATRSRGETFLVREAATRNVAALGRIAAHLLRVLDPDGADRLEREEAEQEVSEEFTLVHRHDGGRGFRGRLTGEDGALLDAALDALAAPRPAQDGTPDPRPAGKRRADALMDLVRLGLQAQDMPWSGGEPVTMTVVTTAGHLRGCDPTQGAGDSAAVLAGASLEDGTPLSPESTRRLCCDSWLVAAILEPSGAVLDIGRRSRIVPATMRRALIVRDGGCAFTGCGRPARWCQAHHIWHWSLGGPTALDNLVLLCPHHHQVVHHHGWTVRLGPDRLPVFIPPAWVDPDQIPRPAWRPPPHPRP